MNFSSSFFTKNRKNIQKTLNEKALLVLISNDQYPLNGDQFYSYRQQSDLFYLTGIEQEKTALILSKEKAYLFILKADEKLETWEGEKLTGTKAQEISGINNILWINDFDKILNQLITKHKEIYLLGKDAFSSDTKLKHNHIRLYEKIKKKNPTIKILSARKLLTHFRLIKSSEEIAMMQKAVSITNKAYKAVLSEIRKGFKETDIEALITYIFKKNNANRHAYDPIIASGKNACFLHYTKNTDLLKSGDLLLMDFGAEYHYYAADLSRTIPVNGVFSGRQRILYQMVLDVQKQTIPLFVPGTTINEINAKANKIMQHAMLNIGLLNSNDIKNQDDKNPAFRKYYMHGLTHFLGIDVHDVGDKNTILKKGMVLTCEPGIYIAEENIGIRIENDIVIDDIPFDLMQNTIREIDDIEKAMI